MIRPWRCLCFSRSGQDRVWFTARASKGTPAVLSATSIDQHPRFLYFFFSRAVRPGLLGRPSSQGLLVAELLLKPAGVWSFKLEAWDRSSF